MAIDENDRVKETFRMLSNGYTREEIADNFKITKAALDQFMRRRGHIWDKMHHMYKLSPKHPSYKPPVPRPSFRVMEVIRRFEDPEADAGEIAQVMHFADKQKMGEFMRSHNYEWCAEERNYVPIGQEGDDDESPPAIGIVSNAIPEVAPSEFVPMLTWLKEHEYRLYKLMENGLESTMEIPRYIVPGLSITKSIQMNAVLAQLVKDFSSERNLRQREVFEAALIDFLRRFGYGERITRLLSI